MSAVHKAASTVGLLTRYKGADHPETQAARVELKAERIADYIEKAVAEAPPLTDEQRARLSSLLWGGAR